MSKLYTLSLDCIEKDDFVVLYNDSYFLGSQSLVPGVSRNSRFVEKEIDAILESGIKEEKDVAKILAWKIGKIKHVESENAQEFCYASDWTDAENLSVTRYGRSFDLKGIASYIVENITTLEKLSEYDPQGVLNNLRDVGTKGIGTVYLITLLYFISRGRYPIYDRFAMMALSAIDNDVQPGGLVEYKDPPSKDSKKFAGVFDNYMNPYISIMTKLFGDDALKNRDVDRALWVYGHCFARC